MYRKGYIMSYKLKHVRVTKCQFCKSEHIVNTVDYLAEIQSISCLDCKYKYKKHGRSMVIVRTGGI